MSAWMQGQDSVVTSSGTQCHQPAILGKSDAGVLSAIKELQDTAAGIRKTAENLRSSLGISGPVNAEAGKEPQDGLRAVIMRAVQLIRAADYDAGECLRHLNS